MRISRNYTADDWKQIAFTSDADWGHSVDIFEDRIETRYLEHIRSLLDRRTSGFVVLALDSTLVETLEQFRRGKSKTPQREGKQYFVSFLTQTAFVQYFDASLAGLFYKTIRCGLLHQAEAGGGSRIKRGSERPLVAPTADHRGIVINSRAFHELLEQVVHQYASDLRDPASTTQRQAFRRKMNYICRIEAKGPEFEDVA